MTIKKKKRQSRCCAKLKKWIVLCAIAAVVPSSVFAHTDVTSADRQTTYTRAQMILDGSSGQVTDKKSTDERIAAMYDYIASRGYSYGNFAKELAENKGFSGASVYRYMDSYSLTQRAGSKLSSKTNLQSKLAQYYLNVFEKNINNNAFKEIAWEDIEGIYARALAEEGANPLYWMLTMPFSTYDEAQKKIVWNDILRSTGNIDLEMSNSANLYLEMLRERILTLEQKVLNGELAANDQSIKQAYQQSRIAVAWQNMIGLTNQGLTPRGSVLGDPFSVSVPDLGNLWRESRSNRIIGNFTSGNQEFSALVLDLNADDVVGTIAPNAYTKFNYQNDGFPKQTGWISSVDGLLVFDRNENGKIDSGQELFGNDVLLANGKPASNGFVALAELDGNVDKVLDAADTNFSKLRVWQDSNLDGKVDSQELKTLKELDIKAINLGYTSKNQTDPQSNVHKQHGSFIKVDGSEGKIASVWFKGSAVNTQEEDFVAVGIDTMQLPEVYGMGTTHSLWQAMARDESGELKALISRFVSATDFDARKLMLKDIVLHWTSAHVYSEDSRGANIDGRIVYALESMSGQKLTQTPSKLEADKMIMGFGLLENHVYGQLMLQTHYADDLSLTSMSFNKQNDGIQVNELVNTWRQMYVANSTETQKLMRDFAHCVRYGFGDGLADYPLLTVLRKAGNPKGSEFDVFLSTLGGGEMIIGTPNVDTLRGTDEPDVILGRAGNDYLYGGGGDDELYGEEGSDFLFGGIGNDRLYGGAGNDYLYGGNSNNPEGEPAAYSEGVKWLEGGAGNDNLSASYGDATYYFERGWDQDIVNNFNYHREIAPRNVILFSADISPEDIEAKRTGEDLYLSLKGGNDQIKVSYYFRGDAATSYAIKEIKFGDGTIWSVDTIKQMVISN